MLSAGRSEIILALRIAHASLSELQDLSNSNEPDRKTAMHFKIIIKIADTGAIWSPNPSRWVLRRQRVRTLSYLRRDVPLYPQKLHGAAAIGLT